MIVSRRGFLAAAAGVPSALPLWAWDLPAADKVKAELVCKVPSYCEGVVFDHEGYKYISHGKFISKIGPDGIPKQWTELPAPNGHRILGNGNHLVCDGSAKAVWLLDRNGKVLGKAAEAFEGKPLRGPNDLTLDYEGGFYFTDPAAQPDDSVYHVDKSGKVRLVVKGMFFPNGIVLRPDNKTLLIGESKKNRVVEVKKLGEGKWSELRVFADLPTKGAGQIDNMPDGMCLDADGNLYAAHWGMRRVEVVSPAGKVIRSYVSGNLTTSNVAFGGAAMDELYVTGALELEGKSEGGLFRLKLPGVKGLRILPKKV